MLLSKEFEISETTKCIVFEDGTVIGPSGKVLQQYEDKDGYLCFHCGGKSFLTHRVVALCFVPNPDPAAKVEVDHKDNNRANPKAENLQWVTHAENVKKAAESGSYSGERNSHCILSKYEAMFIKQARKLKVARNVLAKKFGISEYTVYDIAVGNTWKMLA